MKKNRVRIILLLLIFALGCGPCGLFNQIFDPNARPEIGETAPDFTLTTLTDETYHLEDLNEKFVVLNFWATWCDPCTAELPILQSLYEDYGNKDLVLLTITTEDQETVESFLQGSGYTFPVLIDNNLETYRKYRIMAYPTTYFIQKENIVHAIHVGSLSNSSLRKSVKALMNEPVQTKPE